MSVFRFVLCMVLSVGFGGSVIGASSTQETQFTERRLEMVRTQIEARGVNHKATLEAIRAVPRHLFVKKEWRSSAYDDRPLPIGFGQTISQPFIVAYMTEMLAPEPEHKVLEIGTGSGYQAAVLSHIVKEVFTIEIVKPLAETAAEILRTYPNVKTRVGDGYHGWKEHAPFDGIVVTAAAEHIPPPLISQLKNGGRMIIPVGHAFFVQKLVLVTKDTDGTVRTKDLFSVRFVPFVRSGE